MNRFSLSKFVGISALSLSIGILPTMLPVSAQNAESNRPALDTTLFQEAKNDSNKFQWLGLIGLIGVASLLRKHKESGRQHDPDVGNPSSYHDPGSAHPSSYTDSDAVGRSYTDLDV